MKKIIITSIFLVCILFSYSQQVTFLNEKSFKEKVWNFEKDSEWKFIGDKPMIIDFYADWCRPCKMIAPHLKTLQKEYGSKIQVYKINTDENKKLAQLFKIRSIPALLFIPANGNYKQVVGYRDVKQFEQLVSSILKVEK